MVRRIPVAICFSFLFGLLIQTSFAQQLDDSKTDEKSNAGEDTKSADSTSAKEGTSDESDTSGTKAESDIAKLGEVPEFEPSEFNSLKPTTLEEIKTLEAHVKKIRDKIRPATVNVGGGSGVVISKEGLILTVAHVGRTAGRRITVTFPDGKRVRGEILGNYHGVDAGLAKITEKGEYPYVEMGDSSKCEQGQWCIAAGYPVSFSRAQQPPIRLGRILRTSSRTLVTDCTIMGGDSGGPLFDLDGRVIGMNSRVGGSLTSNIHVPISVYQENWGRLVKGEDWGQSRSNSGRQRRERSGPYLGIGRDRSAEGAVVGRLSDDSPAKKAGIKVGDRILEFNGKPVNDTFRTIYSELRSLKSGDEITIKVERDKKEMEFKVKIG